MNIHLIELTVDEVEGLNLSVIEDAHRKDPNCQQKCLLRDRNGLDACLAGIYYQGPRGYMHLPLEKMAGLLLYRIAQGQFFIDGNKRTALLSCVCFLHNNGHRIRIDRNEVNGLMWGFAPPANDPDKPPRYKEHDSIQFVFDNILPIV